MFIKQIPCLVRDACYAKGNSQEQEIVKIISFCPQPTAVYLKKSEAEQESVNRQHSAAFGLPQTGLSAQRSANATLTLQQHDSCHL